MALSRLALVVVTCAVAACDRPPDLAGSVSIGPAPSTVAFSAPVTPASAKRELCFRFDPPGQSQRASTISVVLIDTSGTRDTLRATADRRGESVVCLGDTSAVASSRVYLAAELSSPAALEVHGIFWGGSRAAAASTRY